MLSLLCALVACSILPGATLGDKVTEVDKICDIESLGALEVECFDDKWYYIRDPTKLYPGVKCMYQQSGDETVYSECGADGKWVEIADPFRVSATGGRGKAHTRKKRGWWRDFKCWWGSCSAPIPRDTTKPTIYNCPPDRTEPADELTVSKQVTWSKPTARDDRDGDISVYRGGPPSDSPFPEGTTTITYHANDKGGNWETCIFNINIQVNRCPELDPIEGGFLQCSLGVSMIPGVTCRYQCYPGYEYEGRTVENKCLLGGRWKVEWEEGNRPRCVKKTCDNLLPPSAAGTQINCSDGNNYTSICTYSCEPGMGILAGNTRVQVCGADQAWKGRTPVCVDIEPPKFTDCPFVVSGYADESDNKTKMSWGKPYATDNIAVVKVSQTAGPPPDTVLPVGEYVVEYKAEDAEHNVDICSFKVIVKQIRCHKLYPIPYTSVHCPEGRRFGSSCQFKCDNGSSMTGEPTAQCVTPNTGVAYGKWSFGNYQPYCTVDNKCVDLPAPDNGALPCDTFLKGMYCHGMCQEGYVFPAKSGHPRLVVCMDDGAWVPSNPIPSCIEPKRGRYGTHVRVDYHYAGPCSESIEEIKEKFIDAWSQDSAFGKQCTSLPDACTVNNVKVVCGEMTGRRKRSSDTVTIEMSIPIDPAADLTGDAVALDIARTRELYRTTLEEKLESGEMSLEIGGTPLNATSMEMGENSVACEDGYERNTAIEQCVPCSPGYFHDKGVHECVLCPRGTYQSLSKSVACITCPTGTTTSKIGDTSPEACIDACAQGTYSATGAPPCTPCDVGTYSSENGTITCPLCPRSKITYDVGARSTDDCFEFDIRVPEDHGGDAEVTLADVELHAGTEIYVSFWFQCASCLGSRLLQITADSTDVLTLDIDNILKATFLGSEINSNTVTIDNHWHNIQLHVTGNGSRLLLDGVDMSADTTVAMPVGGVHFDVANVSLGDASFVGRFSQVQIWNVSGSDVADSKSRCFTDGFGNALSWAQFSEVDMVGAVITDSQCDDFDDCASGPCIHGTCRNVFMDYICTCDAGFLGRNCDENIDDCPGNACVNGGVCRDGPNSYDCQCPSGFKGPLCEIQVDDGQWGGWEAWSLCSVSCGRGTRYRQRACVQPAPSNGGRNCSGNHLDVDECSADTDCPINECAIEPVIPNGDMNCVLDESDMTKRCQPSCHEGLAFGGPLHRDIRCGWDTYNLWNRHSDDLPSCAAKGSAEKNNVYFTSRYNEMTCDSGLSVRELANNNVQTKVSSLECVVNSTCVHKATNTTDCTSTGREKRDSTTYSFTVQLSCDPLQVGMDQCPEILEAALYSLYDHAVIGGFNVQTDQMVYTIDINSTDVLGINECPTGSISNTFYCVLCGLGTYQVLDECLLCPEGTYQDEFGQTDCKQCPKHWTTTKTGRRDIGWCNVSTKEDDAFWWKILLGILGLGGVCALALAGWCIWKRKFRKIVPETGPAHPRTSAYISPANEHFDFRSPSTTPGKRMFVGLSNGYADYNDVFARSHSFLFPTKEKGGNVVKDCPTVDPLSAKQHLWFTKQMTDVED